MNADYALAWLLIQLLEAVVRFRPNKRSLHNSGVCIQGAALRAPPGRSSTTLPWSQTARRERAITLQNRTYGNLFLMAILTVGIEAVPIGIDQDSLWGSAKPLGGGGGGGGGGGCGEGWGGRGSAGLAERSKERLTLRSMEGPMATSTARSTERGPDAYILYYLQSYRESEFKIWHI